MDESPKLGPRPEVWQAVKTNGFHNTLVVGDEGGYSTAYTAGLYHSYQHPEIIMVGNGEPSSLLEAVQQIAENVKRGVSYHAGQEYHDIEPKVHHTFIPAEKRYYAEHVGTALSLYDEDFPLLQCVRSDESGAFPWEEPEGKDWSVVQPLFGSAGQGEDRAIFTPRVNDTVKLARQLMKSMTLFDLGREGQVAMTVTNGAWQIDVLKREITGMVTTEEGLSLDDGLEAVVALTHRLEGNGDPASDERADSSALATFRERVIFVIATAGGAWNVGYAGLGTMLVEELDHDVDMGETETALTPEEAVQRMRYWACAIKDPQLALPPRTPAVERILQSFLGVLSSKRVSPDERM